MYLSINEFKARDFCGSNVLWDYVVVNAPMVGKATPRVQLATWRSYPPRGPYNESSSICVPIQFYDLIFGVDFEGFLVLKMGHMGYRWKA